VTEKKKEILDALKSNFSMLTNILSFLFFFWLLFAILGVRTFQGSLRRQCFSDEFSVLVTPEKWCGSFIDSSGNLTIPNSPPGYPIFSPKGYACPMSQSCNVIIFFCLKKKKKNLFFFFLKKK